MKTLREPPGSGSAAHGASLVASGTVNRTDPPVTGERAKRRSHFCAQCFRAVTDGPFRFCLICRSVPLSLLALGRSAEMLG